MIKFICLLACFTYVYADVASAGRNQYLPPDKGYNYDKPNVPFPSNRQPTQVPFPGTPTPSRPQQPTFQPRPPPRVPSVQPTQGYPQRPQQDNSDHHHHEPGMPFNFQYAVNDAETANDYTHNAVSDGDVTRGEYRVQLPDGRTQIVKYTADWKNGYNAVVSYEGEARYPDAPFGASNNANQGYKY
ncbi:cuticle protein 8 [Bradysia coprophila]|uniref:cuticle protein 8 n=1 Tax=Bradysia coprophila TaxID=38358 RepID=UPI00187DA012|nr:cuticle protein 8 [Bradysia coprophila]